MSAPAEPAPVPERTDDGLAARQVAYELLRGVLTRHRPLDEQLADSAALTALSRRDRAFARNLVATALRRLAQLDALIDLCLEKPLPAAGAGTRDVLRLGIVQLLFLETPPHAAVDRSVELVGRIGLTRFKGLVNAVLRRLAQEGAAILASQDAARINTPDWLWESWSAAYGAEKTRAIAEAHLGTAPIDLTVRRDHGLWAEKLGGSVLPTGSLRLNNAGNIAELTGFEEGAWWVQDAAAALPARLLGRLGGKRIIDLCAAPGGKTAQLASAGARVVALDRSAARLKRLEENLRRLSLSAETVPGDGVFWRPERPADGVLLDAPCSTTGTIRRHPDIPWLKGPKDVERLSALQARLLVAAVEMLRPGGTLVYCTCSLQPEEGPQRIAELLESGLPVERDPVTRGEIGGIDSFVTDAGELRTLPCDWPDMGGIDGFYIARLRRI